MNIKRAKQEIKDAIEAYLLKDEYGNYEIPAIRQRPIFLLGAPGIGKTQIMEQIARECQLGLVSYTITHHTRQSAIGLPFISKNMYGGKEYSVTEYTMSEIIASVYNKMEETGLREGILFIDEINCVSETLAPAMLQFLQCKTFGNHAVPEGWIIVAAGNPAEYNKSVREFDVVTMDRVKKIDVEPDFTVWKEYAYQQGIHNAIISYLNSRVAHFYQMETTVDGTFFATPRGWEDLSRLLQVYEMLGKTVDREVVMQYIQYPKIAKDFANYLELYYKYQTDYQIEEIMQGRIDPILIQKVGHASFDEKLSVVSLLLSTIIDNFRKVYKKEACVSMLFDTLRQYKTELADGNDAMAALNELTKEKQDQLAFKVKAQILNREEGQALRYTIEQLESYQKLLKLEGVTESDAAFDKIRGEFTKENGSYQTEFDKAGQALEYAFDFMEIAFHHSQEMISFVTELNANFYSVQFLQSYECERYYQYNKNLLFDEKRKNILNRIENL